MKTETLVPERIENFYSKKLPPNSEMKCPVVLVVDKSFSMNGDAINELNRGLKIFQTQIQNDEVAASRLDTAVVAFGSDVEVVRDFSLFEGTAIPTIEAYGCTMMVEGVKEAIARIEARKAWYRKQGLQYYRPYLILITDGYPTSSEDNIEALRQEINELVESKKLNMWAFGVEGANMEFLQSLSADGFPAQKLKGHSFVDFFKWLSSSFSAITSSRPDEKIDISPKTEENPFQITV